MNLDKYIQYLKNAGGSIDVKKFDEDWEPVGKGIRTELLWENLAWQEDGVIFLKEKSFV